MRNIKKTLHLFIAMLIVLCLFTSAFTWVNYYQFKQHSIDNESLLSKTISNDIKNRYNSTNVFINTMDPIISKTVKDSLNGIDQDINDNGKQIDNDSLKTLSKKYDLTNIYILDKNGIVKYSTDPQEIGKTARDFYNQQDELTWKSELNKIIYTNDVYIEGNYSRSKINPYRYNKWGYKGIGYVDNVGLVVLEIGLQVMDIKDGNISALVNQILNLNKVNENVASIHLVNLPPNQKYGNFKETQTIDSSDHITTKVDLQTLDGADAQAVVKTYFPQIENSIKSAFIYAVLCTFFYIMFLFAICMLFYFRFSNLSNAKQKNIPDEYKNYLDTL